MEMQTKHRKLDKRTWAFILIGLALVLAMIITTPPSARADGGGFPTFTPTITRTPEATLTPTFAPTATFTSLPPYPVESSIESSGGEQPQQQQVAVSPTSPPATPPSDDGFSLGSCLPIGLIILLAGILLFTFFFARRTRRRTE
jgi:hypothetical protein